MKIVFLFCGKTRVSFVKEGLDFYLQRIKNYYQSEVIETPDVKNIQEIQQIRKTEAERILKNIAKGDFVILLDEKGDQFDSSGMATRLEKALASGAQRVVFVVAGAWGADQSIRQRAEKIWSLSALTFPHQLVRLILSEQMYRCCTILRNEPYHHEG